MRKASERSRFLTRRDERRRTSPSSGRVSHSQRVLIICRFGWAYFVGQGRERVDGFARQLRSGLFLSLGLCYLHATGQDPSSARNRDSILIIRILDEAR